jgi:hypothetical protein
MPVCSAELRPPCVTCLHLQGARHREKLPLDHSADQGGSGVAMHHLLPRGKAAPAPGRLSPQRLTSDTCQSGGLLVGGGWLCVGVEGVKGLTKPGFGTEVRVGRSGPNWSKRPYRQKLHREIMSGAWKKIVELPAPPPPRGVQRGAASLENRGFRAFGHFRRVLGP